MADELFNQADVNKDERLDLNEFRNLLAQNLRHDSPALVGNTKERSPYQSSLSASYGDINGTYGNYAGATELTEAAGNGLGINVGEASYSSYDQSSYATTFGADASTFYANTAADIGAFDDNTPSSFGLGIVEANAVSGSNLNNGFVGASSSSTFEVGSSQQLTQVNRDNPQNLYEDPNPQIIRRAAQSGQLTYTQNIKIRFLQPPPVPPPGPLIIKEVRPPQPPPPPPLRIRQQAPPLPPLPPLVLRERPPVPPASVASETVVRRLPAVPVPPRSIIIERLPPLPPKPRDIFIERWLPYAAQAKRRTIVQRAGAAHVYPKPRNIIILYEPVQVRVVRQFQRFGVTAENPAAYIQRYGAALLDPQILVQQARAAGVIEDISPPNNTAGVAVSSNTEFISGNSGIELAGGTDFATGSILNASTSSSESAKNSGSQNGNASLSGYESVQGADLNGGIASALYQSNSFVSQSSDGTLMGVEFGGADASGYGGHNTSASDFNSHNLDAATAAFNAADQNKDGALDANEFRQFVSSHLQYSS